MTRTDFKGIEKKHGCTASSALTKKNNNKKKGKMQEEQNAALRDLSQRQDQHQAGEQTGRWNTG